MFPHDKSDYRWYVIQAKPHQGDIAERELCKQGYEVWYARIPRERIRAGRRALREEPLFPGYLFIRLSMSRSNWGPLRSTYGVARLVSFGAYPLPVPGDVIAEIQKRSIGTQTVPALTRGDTVSVLSGPWSAIDSVFDEYDGEQRAYVLLNLLGSQQRVSFPLSGIKRTVS